MQVALPLYGLNRRAGIKLGTYTCHSPRLVTAESACSELLAALRAGDIYQELFERLASLMRRNGLAISYLQFAPLMAAMGSGIPSPAHQAPILCRHAQSPVRTLPAHSPGGMPVIYRHLFLDSMQSTPRRVSRASSDGDRGRQNVAAAALTCTVKPPSMRTRAPSHRWCPLDTSQTDERDEQHLQVEAVVAAFRSTGPRMLLGASCEDIHFSGADGKALEHLSALSALKVMFEMLQPEKWDIFVASLSRPTPGASLRMSSITRRMSPQTYRQ